MGLMKDLENISKRLGETKIKQMEIGSIIPEFPYSSMFQSKSIGTDEVIEKLDNEDKELTFYDERSCGICKNSIKESFRWYNLIPKSKDENIVICSYDCLKKFFDSEDILCEDYEIIEHSRCAAYFKCKEMGNLRNKCEDVKNLNIIEPLQMPIINHCESAQAGIILATHRTYEVIGEFSQKTNEKLGEFNSFIKAFSSESRKQYRNTFIMTLLVIILTFVNIGIAYLTYSNDDLLKAISEGTSQMKDINSNIEILMQE